MMFRLVLLIAVFTGTHALAQERVTVKSGEHGDFSRLVFYLGEPLGWKVSRVPEGYALSIPKIGRPFDLSRVFDFIPRSRLLETKSTTNGVLLAVTCDCHADAFEFRPGILVIDIKDGPAKDSSVFEEVLSTEDVTNLTVGTDPDAASLTEQSTIHSLSHHENQTGTTAAESASFPVLFPRTDTLYSRESVKSGAAAGLKTQDQFRVSLSEQLGRAMSDGLATPALDHGAPGVSISNVIGGDADRLSFANNVDMRTATDIAHQDIVSDGPLVDPSCLPEENFDFRTANSDLPPQEQLALARSVFLEDLAGPSSEAVMTLARTYVYLGFGAEAQSILAEYPQSGMDARLLDAIAETLDAPDQSGSTLLREQVSCDTSAALWGFLALGPGASASEIREKAILRTVSALPVHLRRYLVPVISDRFRTLGRPDAAAVVRDTVLRATDAPGDAFIVEVAKASSATSKSPSDANKGLERAAEGNSELSAAAQTELVRQISRVGVPIPQEKQDEITAQIHQTKGTPAGDELVAAYSDALVAAGMFQEAIRFLRDFSGSEFADPKQLEVLVDKSFSKLAAQADSGQFLVVVSANPAEGLATPLSARTRLDVSNRLLELGFPEMSQQFLPERTPPQDAERQFALAQSALLRGLPMEALARVVHLDDPEARAIRVSSLKQTGAFREASALLKDDGLDERAAQLAWLGDDWEMAEQLLPDGFRKTLAQTMMARQNGSLSPSRTGEPGRAPSGTPTQNQNPGQAAGEVPVAVRDQPLGVATASAGQTMPTLRDSRELIEASRLLRQSAEGLFSAVPAPN